MKNLRSVQNISTLLMAFIFAVLTGCALNFQKDKWNLPEKAPNEVSVMSFNMENLFDTVHTEGHEDYTYLPLYVKQGDPKMRQGCITSTDSDYRRNKGWSTNWTQEALEKNFTNISKVVLNVN